MANPIELETVLTAAHKDGMLKPSSESKIYFNRSVNQANRLLLVIAESEGNGLNINQLIARTKLSENTLLIYCRILYKLGFLKREFEKNEKGQPVIYWLR